MGIPNSRHEKQNKDSVESEQSRPIKHFGEHLTIDGYNGKEQLLNNASIVNDILEDLPQRLGMHILTRPLVVSAPENGIKDPGGWSGFVIIAESHISVHTFPRRGFVTADVYTCKNGMDTDVIVNYFKEKFELKEVETNFVIRGKKYPPMNI